MEKNKEICYNKTINKSCKTGRLCGGGEKRCVCGLDKLCHALKAADASGRIKAVGRGDRALPVKPVKGFIKPVAGNTRQLVLFYQ